MLFGAGLAREAEGGPGERDQPACADFSSASGAYAIGTGFDAGKSGIQGVQEGFGGSVGRKRSGRGRREHGFVDLRRIVLGRRSDSARESSASGKHQLLELRGVFLVHGDGNKHLGKRGNAQTPR